MEAQIKYYDNKLSFEIDPSDLFYALNNGKKIIALDTRKPLDFKAEHIPSAINIAHLEMNSESTKHLYGNDCAGILTKN